MLDIIAILIDAALAVMCIIVIVNIKREGGK